MTNPNKGDTDRILDQVNELLVKSDENTLALQALRKQQRKTDRRSKISLLLVCLTIASFLIDIGLTVFLLYQQEEQRHFNERLIHQRQVQLCTNARTNAILNITKLQQRREVKAEELKSRGYQGQSAATRQIATAKTAAQVQRGLHHFQHAANIISRGANEVAASLNDSSNGITKVLNQYRCSASTPTYPKKGK